MNLLTLRPLSSRLGAAPTADTPDCMPAPIRLHRKPAPAPRFDAAAMAAFERGEHPAWFGDDFAASADYSSSDVYTVSGFNAAVQPAEDAPLREATEHANDVLRDLERAIDACPYKEGNLCQMLCAWCDMRGLQWRERTIVSEVPADVLRAWIALPQGEGWRLHRPGDAMPCGGEEKIAARLGGSQHIASGYRASAWRWSRYSLLTDIIAWRPA